MPASIRAHFLQGVAAWVVSSLARSCQAKQQKPSAPMQQEDNLISKQPEAASHPFLPEASSSHSAPEVAGQKRSVAEMEGEAQPETSGSLEIWHLLLLLLTSRELADAPAPDLLVAAATRACQAMAASNSVGAVQAAGREAVLLRRVLLTLHSRFGAGFSLTLEQRWALCRGAFCVGTRVHALCRAMQPLQSGWLVQHCVHDGRTLHQPDVAARAAVWRWQQQPSSWQPRHSTKSRSWTRHSSALVLQRTSLPWQLQRCADCLHCVLPRATRSVSSLPSLTADGWLCCWLRQLPCHRYKQALSASELCQPV